MQAWDKQYRDSLSERLKALTDGLDGKLEQVSDGRVAPGLDDLALGSARALRAAALFFDIRDFSSRTSVPEQPEMKRALYMLDCVIPMVMHVVHDFGGYVEKNTGDGIMAILGAEGTDEDAAVGAISVALTTFHVLEHMVNPHLANNGIPPVHARIGVDIGSMLVARLGVHTGSAKHDRNFLTAVGPAANLARRFQEMAGTDEIWVGDVVKMSAGTNWIRHFVDKTPSGWTWVHYPAKTGAYRIWEFTGRWKNPEEW